MKTIEYLKLQAKNLHRDFRTRKLRHHLLAQQVPVFVVKVDKLTEVTEKEIALSLMGKPGDWVAHFKTLSLPMNRSPF